MFWTGVLIQTVYSQIVCVFILKNVFIAFWIIKSTKIELRTHSGWRLAFWTCVGDGGVAGSHSVTNTFEW